MRPGLVSDPQHARPIQRPLMREARELAEEKAAVLAMSAAAGVHPNDPAHLVIGGLTASDIRHAVRTAYRRGRASRG